MLPPGSGGGAGYDVERGTCPHCGSGAVTHLVIGLLTESMIEQSPDWAVPVGCAHPGHDRVCATCGQTWTGG